MLKQCHGKESCPLRIDHPPNGSSKEECLGCSVCTEALGARARA